MLPGLLMLQYYSQGSVYESQASMLNDFSNLWQPLSIDELQTYTQKYDPRLGEGLAHKPMSNAKEQLMASIVNAVQPKDILYPSVYFCGQSLYWLWALLALCFSKSRKKTFLCIWDVAILSLFALGPFLRNANNELVCPLPYYLYQLIVPSFEQLKHPDRFAPMAAVLAAVPLAFGVERLLKYCKKSNNKIT